MVCRVVMRSEIDRILPSIDVVAAMERAFEAYSDGRANVPPVGELLFENPPGDAHIKYGYIGGDPVFVIKVATGFYENSKNDLPPNSGLMLVFSATTGLPEAVLLDEGHLTNVRTAAAGAVAAKYLAPGSVDCIGVIGSGLQARMQVEQLSVVTACRAVALWGRRREAAEACAADLEVAGFTATIEETPAAVAGKANLIVTATAATTPLLGGADIRPGTHITAMGSDTTEKQELAVELLGAADLVVADSIDQCQTRGEICHALRAGTIREGDVIELGNVVAGRALGRTSEDQVTVADLTGVAVQDIEISKAVLAGLD